MPALALNPFSRWPEGGRLAASFLFFFFVAIPAGSFLALKISALVACAIVFRRLILEIGTSSSSNPLGLFFAAYFFLLCLVGFVSNEPQAAYQTGQQTTLLLLFGLLVVLYKSASASDLNFLDNLMRFSIASYCLIRIALFLLPLLSIISYDDLSVFFGDVGFVFQDLSFFGFPGLVRITTSNDFLLFCIIVLYGSTVRANLKPWFIALVGITLVLSFSRAFLIATFIGILWRTRSVRSLLIAVIFIAVALLWLDLTPIYDFLEFRFGDVDSTDTKVEQTHLLLERALDSYWLGNGAGTYLREYVRSYTEPFTYENYLAQLVMQFGAIGAITAVSPYIISTCNVARNYGLYVGLTFGLVIFGMNLTNPYFSSASAIFLYGLTFHAQNYRQNGLPQATSPTGSLPANL